MSYANITDTPGNSTGVNGSIEWFGQHELQCNELNTYYQDAANDVAAFIMDPVNHPWCGTDGLEDHIIFRDTENNEIYLIRRACMNPVGTELSKLPAPNLVDPPSFQKTYTVNGPVIRWRLVWINQSSVGNVLAQAEDDIPAGTTYVPDSLSCEAHGSSITNTCAYDGDTNQVTWSGLVGADNGNTDEETAANEIVMTFDTSVPPGMTEVSNQATCGYDANDDGTIEPSEEGNCASNQVLASDLYIGPDGSLADTGSPTPPLIAIGVTLILGSLFVLIKRPWALRA